MDTRSFFPCRLLVVAVLVLNSLLWSGGLACAAGARVLMLFSYSPDFPSFMDQLQGVKAGLAGTGASLATEYMDSKRFYDAEHLEHFRKGLERKQAKKSKPNLLITADDNALKFALDNRKGLFRGVPIVFLGVNDPVLAEQARAAGNATGVMESTSPRETIALARKLFPEAKEIAIIYDGTTSGRVDFKNVLPSTRLFPWIRFERFNLARITYSEMAAGLRALPKKSLILLLSAYRDRENHTMDFAGSVAFIRKSSHSPILHLWKHGIGEGLLGGKVVDQFNQGKLAGEDAARILKGESADDLPVLKGEDANRFIFDYEQLAKYNVPFESIPSEVTLINGPRSDSGRKESPFHAVLIFSLVAVGGFLIFHLMRSRAVARKRYTYCRDQLATLLDNVPTGIAVMDNLGKLRSSNAELGRLTGMDEDVLTGMAVVDLLVQEERADFMLTYDRLVRGEEQFSERVHLLRADGNILPADLLAVNFRQGIYVGFFMDMAPLLQARAGLAENEARFRALNEQTEDAMFMHDLSGRYVLVNRKACEILGYTEEELLRKTVWDIDPKIPTDAEKRLWAEVPRKMDAMFRRKDGSEIPVEVQLSRIRFGGRKVVHALARDITDRRIAEQRAMRESMVNLAQAEIAKELTAPDSSIESLASVVRQHAMIITGSTHGYVSSIDPRTRENIPHTFTEMMSNGQCQMEKDNFRLLWHEAGYSSLWGVALNEHKAFYTNDPANHEHSRGLPEGHVQLEQFLSAPAMFEGQLMGQVALANPGRDYTDEDLRVITALADLFALAVQRQEVENALVSAKNAAEAASRAKGEFLANVSHEIRTPLNGIFGMLQLIKATNLDPEQAEYLQTAETSGQNLLRVINDVLDFSKIEAGKIELQEESFSLHKLVKSVHAIFSVQAGEKGVDFRWNVDPNAHDQLIGDAGRIRQILFNLVGNAIKFTNEGEIIIEADTVGEISSPGYLNLFISVSDTGIGIPEEKLDLIFRAFEQVDGSYSRKYPGTGLGLGIVRRFVELMGGQVRVKSSVGMGSTFSFTVRVGRGEAGADATADETGSLELPPLSILLAEDDRVNRITAQRLLEKMGHTVEWAQNGLEALQKINNQPFDCVFMDIQMPQMDGLEAVGRMRASDDPEIAQMPVIALTAHAMKGDREEFLKGGMDGYVSKPVSKNDLEAALRQVLLKGGSYRGLD